MVGIDKIHRNIKNIDVCKIIKDLVIARASGIINTNKNISNTIFFDIGVFDEPYTANITYINGKLSRTCISKFSIATG